VLVLMQEGDQCPGNMRLLLHQQEATAAPHCGHRAEHLPDAAPEVRAPSHLAILFWLKAFSCHVVEVCRSG
jgi:hypothetical protein